MPVKSLSGGERNRVILAKLFTKAANLLVLDEPTNDLDMDTLEILEDKLINYSGTLIIVSHDRQFLDNVVTSTIVFEEDGQIWEYVGGYTDWVRQGHQLTEVDKPFSEEPNASTRMGSAKRSVASKLSYKDQRELDTLPEEIEALENVIASLESVVSAPDFYTQEHEAVQETLNKLNASHSALEKSMGRWTELANRQEEYDQSRKSDV